jgi:hypothetical protein
MVSVQIRQLWLWSLGPVFAVSAFDICFLDCVCWCWCCAREEQIAVCKFDCKYLKFKGFLADVDGKGCKGEFEQDPWWFERRFNDECYVKEHVSMSTSSLGWSKVYPISVANIIVEECLIVAQADSSIQNCHRPVILNVFPNGSDGCRRRYLHDKVFKHAQE